MKPLNLLLAVLLITSCSNDNTEPIQYNNPEIALDIPPLFPEPNNAFNTNKPTKYGVELGKKLFNDKRLSTDNTVSCASCHQQANAFADSNAMAIGIEGRIGMRNTPPLQNMAFMNFYNWDGSKLQLEKQAIVPIITHEEMDSSLSEIISKIQSDSEYQDLFLKTFGDETMTQERIFNSIAQYEYTLISANSKYDKVTQNEGETFTETEARGYQTFQQKCASCHSTELFTDQSFRNIGFPLNPDIDEEFGRARVTGNMDDYMRFRVPSLRNIEYTAPYGSFGQFETLKDVLNYFDNGVLYAENLDLVFKDNNNRIPLTEEEKQDLISFMKTLSDVGFVGN
ncbi:MAG: cytochrome-c peroxidase [Flavobacteriaceae bacterium]